MSLLVFVIITMNTIKEYKKLTHVLLKDWRVLTSEKSAEDIYNWLKENSHILIMGEMHSKYSIQSAFPVDLDEAESFILAQPQEIQQKIRTKISFRKNSLGEGTSLDYIKNYTQILLETNT